MTKALAKMRKRLLSHKKRKPSKLENFLLEAHAKVKEATVQFEKRRASDCKAIKLLVNARKDLERAFTDKEKWAICTVRLQKLVDAWSHARGRTHAVVHTERRTEAAVRASLPAHRAAYGASLPTAWRRVRGALRARRACGRAAMRAVGRPCAHRWL